jgi:hypothetical protein
MAPPKKKRAEDMQDDVDDDEEESYSDEDDDDNDISDAHLGQVTMKTKSVNLTHFLHYTECCKTGITK